MHPDQREQLVSHILDECNAGVGDQGLNARQNEDLRYYLNNILEMGGSSTNGAITESKQVSILLSDLRGFTAISETYPAQVIMELLNRYFSRMSDVIEKYGGMIDKYMGDSIMVLFGAPQGKHDDLERTLACAIDMQHAMVDFNKENEALGLPPLYMGIGINTGQVVAGSVGGKLYREYTVIGDEVNLTSRIEALSLRGQILISENTYQLARHFVEVGEVKEVFVKGKRKKIKLYELLATTGSQAQKVTRQEVRNSPRVAVDMALAYSSVKGKVISKQVQQGRIIDISYCGLRALVNDPIKAMSDLKFSLSLSLLSCEHSDVYAKVLRVERLEEGYLMQCEFTGIDPEGQQALCTFVDNILTGK